MESVQQQSFPISEARVVTPASRPLTKSHPKTLLILALTGMGGLMLGLGIARFRDLSDRVFRSGAQVEASLQTDCLAVLPNVKNRDLQPNLPNRRIDEVSPLPAVEQRGAKHGPFGLKMLDDGARTITRRQNDLLWYVVDVPLSRFTESIRSVKMAADLNGANRSNKIIGITSTFPNEGKSTVAACLAQLMAHTGARTILVDCDLRNPSMTRKLTPAARLGILNVLSGKAILHDVVWTDPSTNLTFLPAVVSPRFSDTNETLASDAAKRMFDKLRESYDYVVVDLSPLAPVVDVRATTRFVDSYIFVVEWGRTRYDAVLRALNSSRGVRDNMLGVILNKADVDVLSRYEGYGYYHNKYLSRYGYTE